MRLAQLQLSVDALCCQVALTRTPVHLQPQSSNHRVHLQLYEWMAEIIGVDTRKI